VCTAQKFFGGEPKVDLFRIGEKIVSRRKVLAIIDKVFSLRALGLSQQEVARRLEIDRTLISRLESAGEIHKGKRIAVLGFPVSNKQALSQALSQEGVEFILLLSEEERWNFVQSLEGPDLLDRIISLLAEIRSYDVVILLGSDRRIQTIRRLLDQEVIELELGQSPIKTDRIVPLDELINIVRLVKSTPRKRTIEEVAHEASG
jgi:transcriptional regulator with XRE-family HTH domain